MAEENMDMNGEDFSQDVTNEESMNGNDNHAGGDRAANGGGGNGENNGSAEAPGRDDDRKLFVGGLHWETSEKELRDHFGQFGDIESINVKTDPQTGRSRGFAFIVFSSADAIEKVTAAGEHKIHEKKVDPKRAKARQGKIFVGGLTTEISDDEIRAYFSQYGAIAEMEMPFDKQKNQRKGFCFITFESEQVVNELLKTPKQTISGKEVDVKRATPKPDSMPMMMRGGGGGRGGPRGMRGRGGGYNQGWANTGNWGYNQGNYGYSAYDNYGGNFDYYGGYGNYGGYDYPGYNYGKYNQNNYNSNHYNNYKK